MTALTDYQTAITTFVAATATFAAAVPATLSVTQGGYTARIGALGTLTRVTSGVDETPDTAVDDLVAAVADYAARTPTVKFLQTANHTIQIAGGELFQLRHN